MNGAGVIGSSQGRADAVVASVPAAGPGTGLGGHGSTMCRMRVVVMGVTGCGKSTVGTQLAVDLNAQFRDGDDLHSEASVAKMASGTPLTDEDRWPWLDAVATWLAGHERAIIACSALRRVYRDRIRAIAGDEVVFIHLGAPQPVLEERVRRRLVTEGHFAPPGLLDSQYATLEPLEADELGGLVPVDTHSAEQAAIAARELIRQALGG